MNSKGTLDISTNIKWYCARQLRQGEQVSDYKTLFSIIITKTRISFLYWQLCTDAQNATCLYKLISSLLEYITHNLCSHLLIGLHEYSSNIDRCQWVLIFLHRGIQWCTSASYAHLCQTLFSQTTIIKKLKIINHYYAVLPPTTTCNV